MLLRELTNPVFTDITFGASHTSFTGKGLSPYNNCCMSRAKAVGAHTSKDPMLQGKNF